MGCVVLFGFCVLSSQVLESASLLAQSQEVQTVNPPPAKSEDRNVLNLLSPRDQAGVVESSVPVLIPADKEYVGELKLIFDEYYFAWSSTISGVELSLEGSRLAYVNRDPSLAGLSMKDKIRETQGVVTVGEHIWYASWQEFGASYVLALACRKAEDGRCGSGDFLLRMANRLRYVGGGRIAKGVTRSPVELQSGAGGSSQCSQVFPCNPPGELASGSGHGRVDYNIYAPGIRFPAEKKPAYANSQVWGDGGARGSGGGECTRSNYSYPWWDNFCETRADRLTPMCPDQTGHQGQDIRPATCVKDIDAAVSSVDGKVTHIGKFSVFVTGKDGTRFHYLHMSNVKVSVGLPVKSGDPLGMVSNVFDGTPTTIHLHFEIFQNISGVGFTAVPPDMSLVKSYERLP
jgi:hypothetical protein